MKNRYQLINQRLMSWFKKEGRHDLPWRQAFSPYEVLVSEFMLQQTTVATIVPRFQEWMKRFPTLQDLAAASEHEILSAWQGLGYYARARRLHAIAQYLVKEWSGEIPQNIKLLLELPGVGPYTAKALLAFAFNQPVEVLDTNIIRVITRLHDLTFPIDTKEGRLLLEEEAQKMLPKKEGRYFASALMDLGSLICTATHPKCAQCPLEKLCQASEPEALPQKKPRAVVTQKKEQRALYERDGHIYLEHSQGPHWKGLWILPLCVSSSAPLDYITSLIYPITRFRVTMELYRSSGAIPKGLFPFSRKELEKIAIPSPHRKALEKILKPL